MRELDCFYIRLLHFGLPRLRDIILSEDNGWLLAKAEMLHNLPSLIGEPNRKRHEYYWFSERETYIKWISDFGSESAKTHMNTFYVPVWKEMQQVMRYDTTQGSDEK